MAFLSIDSDNSILVHDAYNDRNIVADIGGRWDAESGVWRVAFTIENLNLLLDKLKNPSVSFEMEAKLLEQQKREEQLERLRIMSKTDEPVNLRVPGLRAKLYNYQKLGVMYAMANGTGVLLADEMGLGKTIQSMATALMLKSQGKAKNALIVTPASLKFNWPLEIEKFTDEKYVIIDGTPDERIAQWLRNDVFFYVVNTELLLEDLFGGKTFKIKEKETAEQKAKRERMVMRASIRKRVLSGVRERMWDFMAVDEVHLAKHHASKRTRAIKDLRAKFRMALTGTPMDGRLEELHSIMGFVAPGLLSSKTRFYQRHVNTDIWGKVTGYKRISEVSSKIQPFFLRRLKKDVLKDLPDKIYENRFVVMTPEESKIYKQLADNGHEATEDAAAIVAIIRCKQFCNWPQQVDANCKFSSKMESFKEALDEAVIQSGHKALVFSQYKQTVDVLAKVLEDMGLKFLRIDGDTKTTERASMQKTFNEDKSIDIMLGTEAMSTGLNFTAADMVFNFDDNWSPAVMSQRCDRCHRIGQKNVVTVISFICKDTIEERIRSVINQKNKITSQVLGDELEEVVLQRLGPQAMAKLL